MAHAVLPFKPIDDTLPGWSPIRLESLDDLSPELVARIAAAASPPKPSNDLPQEQLVQTGKQLAHGFRKYHSEAGEWIVQGFGEILLEKQTITEASATANYYLELGRECARQILNAKELSLDDKQLLIRSFRETIIDKKSEPPVKYQQLKLMGKEALATTKKLALAMQDRTQAGLAQMAVKGGEALERGLARFSALLPTVNVLL
jgi:hypothetical protein